MFKHYFGKAPLLWIPDGDGGSGSGGGGQGNSGKGGEGGNGDGAGQPPGNQPPADKKPDEELKFSQADVNRIAGERAARAGEAAMTKFLQDLGVENADVLKTALKDLATLKDRDKTEAQKLTDQVTQLTAALEAAKTTAKMTSDKAMAQLMSAAILAEASNPAHRLQKEAIKDVPADILGNATLKEMIKLKEGSESEFEGTAAALKELIKAKPYLVDTGTSKPVGTPRSRRAGQPAEDGSQPSSHQLPVMTTGNQF